jgi:hypothetical protein
MLQGPHPTGGTPRASSNISRQQLLREWPQTPHHTGVRSVAVHCIAEPDEQRSKNGQEQCCQQYLHSNAPYAMITAPMIVKMNQCLPSMDYSSTESLMRRLQNETITLAMSEKQVAVIHAGDEILLPSHTGGVRENVVAFPDQTRVSTTPRLHDWFFHPA